MAHEDTTREDENRIERDRPKPAARSQRKPWSAPTLTVRSVDAVTLGTKSSARPDGRFLFS